MEENVIDMEQKHAASSPSPEKLLLTSKAVKNIKSPDDILNLVPERPLPEWVKHHKKGQKAKLPTSGKYSVQCDLCAVYTRNHDNTFPAPLGTTIVCVHLSHRSPLLSKQS